MITDKEKEFAKAYKELLHKYDFMPVSDHVFQNRDVKLTFSIGSMTFDENRDVVSKLLIKKNYLSEDHILI